MALIVLIAICFLPCSFYVYVLIQWARDSQRRKTFSQSKTQAVTTTRPDRLAAKPAVLAPKGERHIHASGLGRGAFERDVYGIIARSLLNNEAQPKNRVGTKGTASAPRLQAVTHRARRTG
jgi:hypothetical protein